jgi:hypothetical protein
MTLLLVPASAQAATVVVVYDCNSGQTMSKTSDDTPLGGFPTPQRLQTAINNLAKTDVNTIRLIGTCSTTTQNLPNANGFHPGYNVSGFSNLTLRGDSGPATLSSPSQACTAASPLEVLSISTSSRVVLQDVVITGGNGVGVSDSVVLSLGGISIDGSRTSGIAIRGGSGSTVTIANGDVVSNNCTHGVVVTSPSLVFINGAAVRDNGVNGVFAGPSSNVFIAANAVVSGNGTTGVQTSGGRLSVFNSEISWNGGNPTGAGSGTVFPGGIAANFLAGVTLGTGARVMNNSGSGVHLSLNSIGLLTNGATVQGNSGGGVNLIEGSIARLDATGGVPVLSGNGGGSTGDVNCDAYSQVLGNTAGVASNKCQTQGPNK